MRTDRRAPVNTDLELTQFRAPPENQPGARWDYRLLSQLVIEPPFSLTSPLRRSLMFHIQLSQLSLSRELRMKRPCLLPLVVASDGQADPGTASSIAYLVYDPVDGARWGEVCSLQDDILSA